MLAFEHLDDNKDGKISKDEVLKHFSAVDENGDGSVTKDELLKKMHNAHAAHAPAAEGHRPAAEGRPTGPGGPSGFRGAGGPPSADALFDRLDKNRDGKLTSEEVSGMIWERLSHSDADKDGSVSKAELEAHFKQLAPRRGRSAGDAAPRDRKPSSNDRDAPAGEKKEAPAAD